MKTSNKFTLTRIVFAPVFFLLYFVPLWLGSAPGSLVSVCSVCLMIPVLAFAEFTDYPAMMKPVDSQGQRGCFKVSDFDEVKKLFESSKSFSPGGRVSDFGKMFDPFADVFLHLSSFTCFVFSGYMPPILYVLILYREFSQNFLRMVAAKKGTAIAARKGGKLKTVLYVVACFFALVQECLKRTGLDVAWNIPMSGLHVAGICLFVLCVVLSYVSFIDYLTHFGSVLKDAADERS